MLQYVAEEQDMNEKGISSSVILTVIVIVLAAVVVGYFFLAVRSPAPGPGGGQPSTPSPGQPATPSVSEPTTPSSQPATPSPSPQPTTPSPQPTTPSPSQPSTPSPQPPAPSPQPPSPSQSHKRLALSFFKGVWTAPGGEERALEQDTEKMKADGVNIFALSVGYTLNSDGTIRLVLSREWEGNEEEGYITLIRKAHDAGLGVYLSVDVWPQDDQWTQVPEKIREKVMQNLTSACLHWAEIAEQENVELFSPLNEPTAVLGIEDGIKWSENILPLVKQRFTGDVAIKFVGAEVGDFSPYGNIAGYDYVSVHIYAIDTSEAEFFEYLEETVLPFLNWCVKNYNLKGYLFGEMGVPAADEKQQARIFQRFFEETWDNTSGYFLCSWGPKVDPTDPFPDCDFTGRPAESIIREWYTQK